MIFLFIDISIIKLSVTHVINVENLKMEMNKIIWLFKIDALLYFLSGVPKKIAVIIR